MEKLYNREMEFEVGNYGMFEHNKKVCIQNGIMNVTRVSGKTGAYLVADIADLNDVHLRQNVYNTSPKLFNFLEKYIGKTVVVVADIIFVENKTYKNISISNIAVDASLAEKKEEILKELNASVKTQLREAIKGIKNPVLNALCLNVYKNKNFLDLLFDAPATEKTAYSVRGGLAHMIADTVNLTNSMTMSINNDFWDESLTLNLDLMKAGALLCNIGRAYTLQMNEDGVPAKTERGYYENDLVIARDMIVSAINELKAETDVDGHPSYNFNNYIVEELLHMVESCKTRPEFGAVVVPRSKHAAILSNICDVIFTKGLFEKFESDNPIARIQTAYDGGRNYVNFHNVQI